MIAATVLTFLFLCAPAGATPFVVYATDPASTNPGNFTTLDIPGLVADDILGPLSFGRDPIISDLYFTVDRQAVGAPGSDVAKLSDPSSEGGANGDVFFSAAKSATNELFIDGTDLGLDPGFFGDDITGLSLLPLLDNVYFSLSPGSPTLAHLGLSPADILVSGPGGLGIFARATTLGLTANDQLSGLLLSDLVGRGTLNAGIDQVLFTISSFSESATTSGGALPPGNVYSSMFTGSNTMFRSAADLGLLPDDQIQDIATPPIPEPSSWSLLFLGISLIVVCRRASRRWWGAMVVVAVASVVPGQALAADTCSTMAGYSPPVANSAGTLILPDLTTKSFRWISNDPVFGAIDTGIVAATTFTVSAGNPQRVVFTASAGGKNYQGNVILGTYQRGTVNVYTASKLISYLISPPTIKVTNIKFDHKGPNTNPTDAINIRLNRANDLPGAPGNGAGNGEWVKTPNNNQPAAYIANQMVTLKARFTASSKFLLKASISATAKDGLLPNVSATTVNFTDGVSDPEFVEMPLDRATDGQINKVLETYLWKMGGNNDCGTPVVETDTSGPHTIYTVLAAPSSPWYDNASQEPWVSALDFVTDSAKVSLVHEDVLEGAANKIINFLFSGYTLRYDSVRGRGHYTMDGDFAPSFNLTGFIIKRSDRDPTNDIVNCYDLAASAATLINLIGGTSTYRFLGPPWGYMRLAPLIGRGNANNPFFLNIAVQHNAMVDATTCAEKKVANPSPPPALLDARWSFGNHAFVTLNGNVYDAMAGPATGSDTVQPYLTAAIDTAYLPTPGCIDRNAKPATATPTTLTISLR